MSISRFPSTDHFSRPEVSAPTFNSVEPVADPPPDSIVESTTGSTTGSTGSNERFSSEDELGGAWLDDAWSFVTSIELPELPSPEAVLNGLFREVLTRGPLTIALLDEVVRLATRYIYIEGREHFGGYPHDGSGAIVTSTSAALDGLSGLIEQFKAADHPYPYLAAVEELFDGATIFAATSIDSVVGDGATPTTDAAMPLVVGGVGSVNPSISPTVSTVPNVSTGTPIVPEGNVFADAQAQARATLQALGFDGTSSSGAPIYIVDLVDTHAQFILHMLTGETALMQGANAKVLLSEQAIDRSVLDADLGAALEELDTILVQDTSAWTYDDLIRQAFLGDVEFFLGNASRLADVGAQHPGGAGFINMSFGRNELIVMQSLLDIYDQLPADGPARMEIDAAFTTVHGRAPGSSTADRNLLMQMFLADFRAEANLGDNLQLQQDAVAVLNDQILALEAQGLLVFTSGGNNGQRALELLGDKSASVSLWTEVAQANVVGAISLGSATRGDEYVPLFAASGAVDFVAPGVDIPVGLGADANTDGSSLSAPYVLQVAYLVYEDSVRRGAPLSVSEIEAVLSDPVVLQEIVFGSAGSAIYAPDPVYAVLRARGLMDEAAIEAALINAGAIYRPVVGAPAPAPTPPAEGGFN